MKIIYKPRARESIAKVAEYIEGINTAGSGNRWAAKLTARIESLAKSKAKFALCAHRSLAKYSYSCYTYNDWVIAFKIEGNEFVVYQIVRGSILL